MHPHHTLIEQFYTHFSQRQPAGMIACYAPEVVFEDEVFSLRGKRAGAMWHMLCEGGRDLTLTFGGIEADDRRGRAHWEAHYTFSATGRRVHNIIEAEFVLAEGRIVAHRDRFDFWRWSRMALGAAGWALGWTPLVRRQVQQAAAKRLDRFVASHPEYQ